MRYLGCEHGRDVQDLLLRTKIAIFCDVHLIASNEVVDFVWSWSGRHVQQTDVVLPKQRGLGEMPFSKLA